MGLFGRIGGGLGSAFGSIFGRGGSAAFSPPTRGELVGLFGNPRPANLTHDSIASEIFVAPYRGPGDLDRYGRETPDMRNRYRTQYLAEPVVKAAVQGKVSAVSILEVSVLPADRRNPIDRGIAEFVHWTIARARGGWHGLIRSILTAGVIDGWSLCEKKLHPVRYKSRHLWGLDHVRNIDTQIMRLELDVYRNVTAIVNMVRGIEYYSPDQVLLYTHNPLYSNPFGHSDLRAATRAANIIEDAYKLWYILLNRFGTPYFHGKAKDPAQRKMLEAALVALRAGGWAVTGVEDEIVVLDLAVGAGSGAFKDIVQTMREDVLFAIRGAALPFLEGDGGNSAHGDTNTQKVATDVTEEMLALDAMEVINHQLIPWLVRPNWGETVDLPTAVIGMTNVGEMLQVAQMVKAYQDTGLALSKEWVYQLAKAPPPDDPEDELKAPAPPQPPGGGMPGMGPPGLNGKPPGPPEANGTPALPAHPPKAVAEKPASFAAGYDEADHPRDDHGRFVDADEMEWAKTDKDIAADLRKQVTDPAERAKLEAKIGGKSEAKPAPKVAPAPDHGPPNPDVPDAARPSLDPHEIKAIQSYCEWDYDALNRELRKTGQPPKALEATAAALESAFAKASPFGPPPVVANRALSIEREGLAAFVEGAKKAAESGGEFPMGGFISTEVNPRYKPDPTANVQLRINAIHGLDVMPYSKFGGAESELLLNHGSKFRVKSVTQVGRQWHVELDQVA